MAKRTINTNQLTPGSTMLIRGKLTFSRVARQVEGEELARDQQRKAARGMQPIDRPYTTASICNASVIVKDPARMTPEEIYANESLYQSTSPNVDGNCYTGYNKGRNLPWIGQLNGNQVQQIAPEGELASGLDVTLVIRVFDAKPNRGVTLDGIIVNEPVRWFTGGVGTGLAAHGLTFNPMAAPVPAPAAAAPVAPVAPVAPAAPAVDPYAAAGAYQTPYGGAPTPGGIVYNPNEDPNRAY